MYVFCRCFFFWGGAQIRCLSSENPVIDCKKEKQAVNKNNQSMVEGVIFLEGCVCLCEREGGFEGGRQREGKRERGRERQRKRGGRGRDEEREGRAERERERFPSEFRNT